MTFHHETVLKDEAVQAMNITADGAYIDGTFGVGGHSRQILAHLGVDGKLFAYDKDLNAAALAATLAASDNRLVFKHASFAQLQQDMLDAGYSGKIAAILFDLGVSSCQLDDGSRGFSFQHDGPLDMRMDNSKGQTAADWVNSTPEQDIADTIYNYGDERCSRRIAKAIVRARRIDKITTTLQLANIIAAVMPRQAQGRHPATRTFQAIRIEINNELDDIKTALESSLAVLQEGGRLVILSFHSGEDRVVKHYLRHLRIPAAQTQNYVARLAQVGRIRVADDREVAGNPRARSVKMRVFEKIVEQE